MDQALFLNGLIYIAAAALAAPLGKRFGLGAVLGYLIIGALIGPSALELLRGDREKIMHFAEFGVVLMLFVVGLELDLSKLWRMRGPIFGLGGLQVLLTTLAVALTAMAFQTAWREAIALGMILALSSTAIVMQTLRERGLMETSAGKQSFAVLLFQDIAVIPILAILPLLAINGSEPSAVNDGHAPPWIDSLPGWGQALAIPGAVGIVIIIGRFLLNPWLRWVTRMKVTEALTATALTLVIGVALLMDSVGLSPALGTFVAGVMLASSQFRHELESDIEPFKALLLAVFFLSVGANIDFGLIASQPLTIASMVFFLIALKFIVLLVLAMLFGLSFDQRLIFAAALAQGGEFAFVLGAFAIGNHVIPPELGAQMIAAVALSMAVAPLLLLFVQKVILPRTGTLKSEDDDRSPDVENDHARVLLAGFGRFGHPIIRLLRSAGEIPTVLERDSDHADFIRKIGMKCYYGNATRLPLLKAAGAESAELLIIAIDDEDDCLEIVRICQDHFPHLKVFARACSRLHAYRLKDAGVKFFVEQLGSSLDCAIAVFEQLGHQSDHAKDAARRFKEHELKSIQNMNSNVLDEQSYLGAAQQNLKDLDSLLVNAPLPTRKP
ncbi:monovalent cation:proton antiporter-2 (CPA2) family protein [Verrucomicrobiaceae bacterium 227]